MNYCDLKISANTEKLPVLYYDWIEVPKIVRIVSDSLALDHTFFPGSCDCQIGIKELQMLLQTPTIDEIYIFLEEKNKAYYVNAAEECIPVTGWIALSSFSTQP